MITHNSNREEKELSEADYQFQNDLNFPNIETLSYTYCYCEENIYKLCEYVKNHQPELMPSCYAIFISNDHQTVPLWNQKSGRNDQKLAVWDYHVIFMYHVGPSRRTFIYDFDSVLPFPIELEIYAVMTLRLDSNLDPCFHRHFRVIPCETFLQNFASDRSRMKKPDGTWVASPPDFPCISTPETTNNLDDFISMDPNRGVGEVLSLGDFVRKYL